MPAWVRLKKMEMFPYFIAPGFTESLTLMSIIDLCEVSGLVETERLHMTKPMIDELCVAPGIANMANSV